MTRIVTLVLMLSFFGFSKSKAQENEPSKEIGVIGEYYENDLPVIVKFVDGLPNEKRIARFPFLTVVSWNYDGSDHNGMPSKKVNERMIALERALERSIDKTGVFMHVYSRTGNNLKELVYYTTQQDDFMEMLNQSLEKHEVYPIEINFYEDKDWSDFKKLLSTFKK